MPPLSSKSSPRSLSTTYQSPRVLPNNNISNLNPDVKSSLTSLSSSLRTVTSISPPLSPRRQPSETTMSAPKAVNRQTSVQTVTTSCPAAAAKLKLGGSVSMSPSRVVPSAGPMTRPSNLVTKHEYHTVQNSVPPTDLSLNELSQFLFDNFRTDKQIGTSGTPLWELDRSSRGIQ